MRYLLCLVLITAIASPANAGTPQLISYQGRLLDDAGAGVTGEVEVVFTLYADEAGTISLWTETHTGVAVSDGLFSVLLGSVSDLDVPAFNGSIRYLGVSVDGVPSAEPAPIVSVAYALRAGHSDTAAYALAAPAGSAGGWTDDGAVVRLATASDSVGIGVADPEEKLDVSGNCRVSGSIIVGDNTRGGGDDANAIGSNCRIYDDSCFVGGFGNTISGGGTYAVISGGYGNQTSGRYATIGGGANHMSNSSEGTAIGGGRWNLAFSDYATIAGGHRNGARGMYSTVGGGSHDTATGDYATIAGGQFNLANGSNSFVGGGGSNVVEAMYSVIAGGYGNSTDQTYCAIGGGRGNDAGGSCAAVGGGQDNDAGGMHATISGGEGNEARTTHSTVGGGNLNIARGYRSTIAGGVENYAGGPGCGVASGWKHLVGNSPDDSGLFVGGGWDNLAVGAKFAAIIGGYDNHATGDYAVTAGGRLNRCSGLHGAVAGGYNNNVEGESATVSGGQGNEATGDFSIVSGGRACYAVGHYSFAAGRLAKANHQGSFVWADATDAAFESTGEDQFLISAAGGVGINGNVPKGSLDISQNSDEVCLHFSDGTRDITWMPAHTLQIGQWDGVDDWRERMRISSGGYVGIGTTSPAHMLDVAGDIRCDDLYETSDIRLKRNIASIDNALDKIGAVRGVSFEWTEEIANHDGRQLGVIAQEIETVLPELVSTDADGMKSVDYTKLTAVLIEAVKELRAENEALNARLEKLEGR